MTNEVLQRIVEGGINTLPTVRMPDVLLGPLTLLHFD